MFVILTRSGAKGKNPRISPLLLLLLWPKTEAINLTDRGATHPGPNPIAPGVQIEV